MQDLLCCTSAAKELTALAAAALPPPPRPWGLSFHCPGVFGRPACLCTTKDHIPPPVITPTLHSLKFTQMTARHSTCKGFLVKSPQPGGSAVGERVQFVNTNQ